MLSLRARLFIIISLVVLFILGISLFLYFSGGKKNNQPADEAKNPLDGATVVESENFNTAPEVFNGIAPTPTEGLKAAPQPTEEAVKNSVRQLAKIFIERYGSYSSDNNYQNIKELEGLVTKNLWTKLSAQMRQPRPAGFTGVTTVVISNVLSKWDVTGATASLQALRTEFSNGTTAEKQQAAEVWLVKKGEDWLVDKFEWK